MSVVADYPDYSPHVAHADQIAATGVPLLTKSSRLYQQADPNLGPGVTHSTGNLTVTQIGYEVLITLAYTTAPTNPFVEVTLTWIDSTTGFTITADTFYAPGPSPSGSISVHARGPSKADILNVSYTNLASAGLVTVGLTVLNNSRVYPHDMVRWINSTVRGSTFAGFTLATLPDDNAVLGTVSAGTLIASGNSQWLVGPGLGGWVNLAFALATVTPSSIIVTVYGRPSSAYGGTAYAFRTVATALAGSFTFKSPSSPMMVEFNNSSTTAGTVSFCVTAGS